MHVHRIDVDGIAHYRSDIMCLPYISQEFIDDMKSPGFCHRCDRPLNGAWKSVFIGTDIYGNVENEIVCLKCSEDG